MEPPSGWGLYFAPEEYSPDDKRTLLVAELCRFFHGSQQGGAFLKGLRPLGSSGKYALELDYASFSAATQSRDLEAAIENAPGAGLGCIGLAAYEVRGMNPNGAQIEAFALCGAPPMAAVSTPCAVFLPFL